MITVASDEAAAQPLEKSLTNVLRFACEQVAEQVKFTIPEDESATATAGRQYVDRLSAAISKMLVPRRDGKRLVLEMEGFDQVASIATLMSIGMPAVEAARFGAMRVQGSNNLRQLGLAMHNFESTYRKLPATAILEQETGKPLLSWRLRFCRTSKRRHSTMSSTWTNLGIANTTSSCLSACRRCSRIKDES